jgi:NADH-quinone oxidoreductase subunit J
VIRRALLVVLPVALLALFLLPLVAQAQEAAEPPRPTLRLAAPGNQGRIEMPAPQGQPQAQPRGRLVIQPDAATGAQQPEPTGKGSAIAFWIFAIAAVVGSIATITRKNAITAVMSLVATFFAIAGIYAMLFASFMAAIQVLVYAGAIMVLFVFVVMILNKEEEEPWTHRGFVGKVFALAGVVYLVGRLGITLWKMRPSFAEPVWRAGEFAAFGTTKAVGAELFTTYLFPFEAISIALLIAIVGAVVLAHPDHPTEKADGPQGPAQPGEGGLS